MILLRQRGSSVEKMQMQNRVGDMVPESTLAVCRTSALFGDPPPNSFTFEEGDVVAYCSVIDDDFHQKN